MRTLSIACGLIAAAAVANAACSTAQGTEARPARPVKVQPATLTTQQTALRYSASIEPFEQVPLAFKTSGYVESLPQRRDVDGRPRTVQAGDLVGKGTVLAQVHQADYRERVAQGQARLAEGEASLTKARLDLDRARTLFAAESLTKPDLDSAQAAFDAAASRVAGARSDIAVAMNALNETALVAPSAGVLLERRIEIGTLVAPGTIGYLLGDVSAVKARFGIPDSAVPSVSLGDRLDVMVEALAPTVYAGRVTAIAPAADPQSRIFAVEVTIANGTGALRPGMIGTVAIARKPGETPAPTLTLPLGAIVRSADGASKYAVLVVERDGEFEVARVRPVELGEVMGNGVAVTRGITAGERVVTTGATLLTDGDRVNVIP